MRRSAAPSQQGKLCKRPRFSPPFAAKTQSTCSSQHQVTQGAENNPSGQHISKNTVKLCTGKENHLGGQHENEVESGSERGTATFSSQKTELGSCAGGVVKSTATRPKKFVTKSFKPPLLNISDSVKFQPQNTAMNSSVEQHDGEAVSSCYYNVMWCKRSKKKHKVWEGDAILIVKGRSVTLLDMDSKEIGKTNYKASEVSDLSEGQSLLIGGKEVEVMGIIDKADYHSGKCFLGAGSKASACSQAMEPFFTKAFVAPVRSKTNPLPSRLKTSANAKPLFDPERPDALVLPRPSKSHEWQNNQHSLPVLDVVVDPHLGDDLRPHQREGVVFLYKCILGLTECSGYGAILADDMGLGKTLQCITLIWTLFKQGPYGGRPLLKRILVVTPGSLVKNWCREFKKWLGKERMSVFAVSGDNRVQEFINSPIYPVMIISYDMVLRCTDDMKKIKFDLMVCDEAHRLKNSSIKTSMILSDLNIKRRILLTGTPIQNDLQEFYSLAEFANPSVLGSSSSFHRVYEEPILRSRQPDATEEEKVIGNTRAEELARLTSFFVLRRTQEINNKYLPPKVEFVVFCSPTPLQQSLYRLLLSSRLVRKCLTKGAVLGGANAPHLVCIGALKKLCNDPSLLYEASKKVQEDEEQDVNFNDEEESVYSGLFKLYPENFESDYLPLRHSGKLHVLANLLQNLHQQAVEERIVVVSNYAQTLDVIQRLCDALSYKWCRLDGSTPTSKRQEIVEHFNSKHSTYTIFLLSSKAGGVGLNLIGASRLVLYDIDWNPANDLQAMARVWRDGQRKRVHIYRLITAGTIEEKIYQRQISKQGLSGAVVDTVCQSEVKFSIDELRDLFTLKEDAVCLTHEKLSCPCSGNGLNKGIKEEIEMALPDRPCQLARQTLNPNKGKNISMGALLLWKHFKGPLSENFEDTLLVAGQERITYVFQNETHKIIGSTAGATS